MIVHLDTCVLIDALTGPRRSLGRLIDLTHEGHRVGLSALVLYEWLRGPRTRPELAAQEQLFPQDHAAPFGFREAAVAADLYRSVKRPRGREIDVAIAACALANNGALWTLNQEDFADIPALQLL